jgi:hypothetical protein
MKAELESGAWVELLDIGKLTAREKAVYSAATIVPVRVGDAGVLGMSSVSLSTIDDQHKAVLAALIKAWSFELILPSEDMTVDVDNRLIYDQSLVNLPIDDYNELIEILDPYLDKLRGGPKARTQPKGGPLTGPSSSSSPGGRAPSSRKG